MVIGTLKNLKKYSRWSSPEMGENFMTQLQVHLSSCSSTPIRACEERCTRIWTLFFLFFFTNPVINIHIEWNLSDLGDCILAGKYWGLGCPVSSLLLVVEWSGCLRCLNTWSIPTRFSLAFMHSTFTCRRPRRRSRRRRWPKRRSPMWRRQRKDMEAKEKGLSRRRRRTTRIPRWEGSPRRIWIKVLGEYEGGKPMEHL